MRLILLAPEISYTILTGNLPDNFSVDCLKQALPVLWSEQKKLLGIGDAEDWRSGAIRPPFAF